jgi:DNA-binding transcriptional LysR family regulator
MNFRNIQYFIAIADEHNISSAARKLYISQQSLSEQLKRMEDELGTPLFKRGKTLTLTPAGEIFYESGKKLLSEYDQLLRDIQDVTNRRKRNITLGISTYSQPPFLPELISTYKKKYPEYNVSVIKRQHSDISQSMNGVDLYISYLPLPPDLCIIPILENDPCCAAFRRSLAERIFAGQWKKIQKQLENSQDLSLLRQMPFIILRNRLGEMTDDLKSIFHEYRMQPVIGFESENGELNLEMCRNSLGAVIGPRDYLQRSFTDDQSDDPMLIFPIHVESFPAQLAVCYKKGHKLHPAELCLISTLRSLF